MSVAEARNSLRPSDARSRFAITKKRAYLNNASIGPVSDPVMQAVTGFLTEVRETGRNNYPEWCKHADTTIKASIASLIGADRSEIAFVKNTTEGLNFVANGLNWRSGDNVAIADIEYPSNVYCWMHLQRRGVEVRWVKSQQGRVPLDEFAKVMDSRTRVVSVSAVQFSTGFRADLAALGELCRSRGVLLNVDAIQWVGSLAMDLSKLNIDFLSAGGHKGILGPIGTGIFYCRKQSMEAIVPPSVGFHSVDKGEAHMDYQLTFRDDAGRFEEALANLPGIWGLHAAIELHRRVGSLVVEQHILELNEYAVERLLAKGCTIVSSLGAGERSSLLCFKPPSSSTSTDEQAQRLRAANVDVAVRAGALRISPSYYNDRSDIDALVDEL